MLPNYQGICLLWQGIAFPCQGGALAGQKDLASAILDWRADLRDARFRGVSLEHADLRGVDLTGADLSGARLAGADFTDADLTGADFTRAVLTGAVLPDSGAWQAKVVLLDTVGPDGTLLAAGIPAPVVPEQDAPGQRTPSWRLTSVLRVVLTPDQTRVITAYPVRP